MSSSGVCEDTWSVSQHIWGVSKHIWVTAPTVSLPGEQRYFPREGRQEAGWGSAPATLSHPPSLSLSHQRQRDRWMVPLISKCWWFWVVWTLLGFLSNTNADAFPAQKLQMQTKPFHRALHGVHTGTLGNTVGPSPCLSSDSEGPTAIPPNCISSRYVKGQSAMAGGFYPVTHFPPSLGADMLSWGPHQSPLDIQNPS